MTLVVLIVMAVLIVPALGAGLWGLVARTPRVGDGPSGDLVILAAHQDDCAIMGGELAWHTLRNGRSVSVVYLTCGDRMRGSERSLARRRESLEVWRQVGVPESNVTWLETLQSDVDGPSLITDHDRSEARARLVESLRCASAGTTVVIPADGELHVDHRTLREIAVEAWIAVAREDLTLVEAPEYSPYYSLARNPRKAARYVIEALPIVSKLFPLAAQPTPELFVDGSSGMRLPPDASRLEAKATLLRGFVSENSDLLLKLFLRPDIFRPVSESSLRAPSRRLASLRVRWRWLAPSVVSLWLGLIVATLSVFAWATQQVVAAIELSGVTAVCAVLLGAFIIVRSLRGLRTVENRAIYLSMGLGLIVGAALGGWSMLQRNGSH